VLEHLGARVEEHGEPDHLPVTVHGSGEPSPRSLSVRGDVSSQLVSGLLLAGPLLGGVLRIDVEGTLVSRPYVDMTLAVLAAFGASAGWASDTTLHVEPGGYRGIAYSIEPDASAASYVLAAAAICGGRVRVAGLGTGSLQGDLGFARVLERMGAEVRIDAAGTEVRGTGPLRGVDVDLRDLSDTAPTLAVVATRATSPTRIRGIGFIRRKESDRIGNVARELRRCGIRVDEEEDGLVVHPGHARPARVETYGDHRMAMSFAVLGLVNEGIDILDPDCVRKTFPRFFEVLDSLRPA
jgi:3-phosphoshikimate 1-carboxyvinyltransferase